MKTDYFVRKENRIERFKELAIKSEQESNSAYKAAKRIGDCIPFGQPIMVGHHSEKRHRSDINKIDNNMRKSVEASNKAAYYANRAESAESNDAISSDNPNALELLKEKLQKLQQFQETAKQINKIIRSKKIAEMEKVDQLKALGMTEATAIQLMAPGQFGGMGVPQYKLTNNNGNMARIKQRIAQLEKIETLEEKEIVRGDVKILFSPEKNRVQIFFPGKPSEEVRTELKSSGFRWSPYESAWQRHLSSWALHQAESTVKRYY